MNDNVNHPAHYQDKERAEGVATETIQMIRSVLSPSEYIGYLKGNILKYTDRYKEKNGLEDLKKASIYLRFLVEYEGTNDNGQ